MFILIDLLVFENVFVYKQRFQSNKTFCCYWMDKNLHVNMYRVKHPVRVTIDTIKCDTVQHLEFVDERSKHGKCKHTSYDTVCRLFSLTFQSYAY